jgi:hypothetical protein
MIVHGCIKIHPKDCGGWIIVTGFRVLLISQHLFLHLEINSKATLRNINDVFVFAKQCQQVYYTYTPSFRKDQSRVDWLSVLKTKPWSRVEVVQDENKDTSVRDEVFQVSEVVEPYQVALSIVDTEEFNFVLSSSGQANVDEEDDIHIEDCDEGDDNLIDNEEEEKSD